MDRCLIQGNGSSRTFLGKVGKFWCNLSRSKKADKSKLQLEIPDHLADSFSSSIQATVSKRLKVTPFHSHPLMADAQNRSRHAKRKKFASYRWAEFQRQAKRRRLAVAITQGHHALLTTRACLYCGMMSTEAIGIDRFNNEEGYTIKNSVPCCKRCNFMKADMSIFDFLQHVMLIAIWTGRFHHLRQWHQRPV